MKELTRDKGKGMKRLTTVSGEPVSKITLGSWGIEAGKWDATDSQEIIDSFKYLLNRGINSIDTARAYANAEESLSRVIKDYDRESLFIASKCTRYRNHETGVSFSMAKEENIFSDCEASLKALNTDYIDLMLIHWPDPNTPIEETMQGLDNLKKSGKVRYIGFSNFSLEQVQEAHNIVPVDAIQARFSMIDQEARDLFIWASQNDIFTSSYGSLAAGFLTGSIRETPTFAASDARSFFYPYFKEPFFSKGLKLLDYLDELAEKYDKTVSQIVLKWSAELAYLGSAIIGVRKLKHAKDNIITEDWSLTNEEKANIDIILKEEKLI